MTPEQRERWRSTILPLNAAENTNNNAGLTPDNSPAGGSFRLPRQRSNSFSAGASQSRRSSVPTLPFGPFLAGLSEVAATASSPSCFVGSSASNADSAGHCAAAPAPEDPSSLAPRQPVGGPAPLCFPTPLPPLVTPFRALLHYLSFFRSPPRSDRTITRFGSGTAAHPRPPFHGLSLPAPTHPAPPRPAPPRPAVPAVAGLEADEADAAALPVGHE
jgi:hypothetical protein